MAIRERLRSLLRVHARPAAVAAPSVVAAPVAANEHVATGLATPGTALLLDLDEVGPGGLRDVRAPHVVVTAADAWRAAAAAEILTARGQPADWWERT